MTTFRLRGLSKTLGLNPRRRAAPDGGSGPPDTEAPSVPQNLSATAVSDDQIDLTWDASIDNVGVTGYKIYRDNALVDTSPTNSYSDTGLASETEYQYEVSAFDAAANESARSAPDSATTAAAGDTEAPSVPQNLVATAVSSSQIDLTWDASTDNVGVTGYNIYRDNVLVDTSPTNAYSDTGLAIETEYEYEVSAFDAAANESARSAPDSATTAVARLAPEFVARGTASVTTVRDSDAGFTYPTEDVREDDLFVALIAVNDRGATPDVTDTASGWTRLGEVQHNELALAVFYKRADGTETGAVTPFDWSSGDDLNDVALCQMYQFRYVDWTAGGPFVGAPSSQTGDLSTLAMPSVTTQGENGLAVAVAAFSDNVSEPAAIISATGGTWIAPRDQDSTTAADDAALQAYVASLAEAGTISGGSISITPSSPQSSRSIAIGFALRGMVDPEDYATLSVSIAASQDDAREAVGTTQVFIDGTTIFITNAQTGGFRFTGVSALAGKTILQANMQFTAAQTGGFSNNQTWTIKGEAADTAAQYAASNGDISSRSLTTASRTWTLPGWTLNDRTIRQRSVDVRDIVQEVSDRAGFGGVVNFIITGATNNSRVIAAWDDSTLQEANLTVRYLP
jgi:chitodextrinase